MTRRAISWWIVGATVGWFLGVYLLASPVAGDVCWDAADGARQCVPLSVIQATFAGYQPGGAPPTNSLKQDLINVQSQLADTLKNFRQCEGALGPLQADAHTRLLQLQQQQLNNENSKAAPPGTVWDAQTGKYVPAPPATAPDVAAPGRGRGGL